MALSGSLDLRLKRSIWKRAHCIAFMKAKPQSLGLMDGVDSSRRSPDQRKFLVLSAGGEKAENMEMFKSSKMGNFMRRREVDGTMMVNILVPIMTHQKITDTSTSVNEFSIVIFKKV